MRVVTLTECGTHAQVDAAVGGFNGGERDLAIALAGSAAGMLVVMDRNFPGVALWKAYLEAGTHLLLRARSPVAHRPVEHLDDGTYLARMNLAGQKGAHPGGVLVRVIECRVVFGCQEEWCPPCPWMCRHSDSALGSGVTPVVRTA